MFGVGDRRGVLAETGIRRSAETSRPPCRTGPGPAGLELVARPGVRYVDSDNADSRGF